jgi:hypothetical protein
MGYPDTAVTRTQLLGMRIDDLYSKQEYIDITTMPFEEICQKAQWTPPWSATLKS